MFNLWTLVRRTAARLRPGKPDPQPPLTPLMQALGFTWDDLEANRAGTAGARQLRRLAAARNGQTMIIVGILLLLPLFFTPWLERLMGVLAGIVSPVGWSFLLITGVALLPLAGIWWAVRILSALNADLQSGAVEAISEQIKLMRQPGGVRLIALGRERWHISRAVYDALGDGARYRLYISPRARVLLGAEPLGEPCTGEA